MLEGAEAGLALASGMGAITATLWTLLAPGDEVIVDKTLYGCTFAFMQHGLAKFGITITHVDLTEPENLREAMNAATKVVYFETPANPNMRLVDIAAVSAIARPRRRWREPRAGRMSGGIRCRRRLARLARRGWRWAS